MTNVNCLHTDKKLIRRRDSERELFYDDIVHKFGEIMQNNGPLCRSRSPILVPIESSCTTSTSD